MRMGMGEHRGSEKTKRKWTEEGRRGRLLADDRARGRCAWTGGNRSDGCVGRPAGGTTSRHAPRARTSPTNSPRSPTKRPSSSTPSRARPARRWWCSATRRAGTSRSRSRLAGRLPGRSWSRERCPSRCGRCRHDGSRDRGDAGARVRYRHRARERRSQPVEAGPADLRGDQRSA